jgi:hypothetical protein
MTITCEVKDSILEKLCAITPERHISFTPKDFGMPFDALNAVLSQFQRLGFISKLSARRVEIGVTVHLEAHDYLSHGGFVAQEELLAKNLQKLLLEIESLKPSMPERVNTITTIIASITSFLGLVIK